MDNKNPLCEKYRGILLHDSEDNTYIIVSDNGYKVRSVSPYALFKFNVVDRDNHGQIQNGHYSLMDGYHFLNDRDLASLKLTAHITDEKVGWVGDEKTYYKVVCPTYTEGTYMSAMQRGEHKLYYSTMFTTKPMISDSKLFLFEDIEGARYFRDNCTNDGVIFECEVTNPTILENPRIARWSDDEAIFNYWVRGGKTGPNELTTRVTGNTILVDSVRLIKEVK